MSDPERSGRFDPRTYHDPVPNAALIHALGPINRLVLFAVMKLRRIDLPQADLARLRQAVHPKTVAFLGPNHPEFLTDWLIDKEISRRVSPLMAHWAAWEIVNMNPSAQAFWLRNNLIANAPGGGGKEYSIRWARNGHGVLLHPEGGATWRGDHVGRLVPGIVDMAWESSRRLREAGLERPVRIVPIVWKLHFDSDVRGGLMREIQRVERGLGLPQRPELPLQRRFGELQAALLGRQHERLGLGSLGEVALPEYFEAQRRVAGLIRERLETAHGAVEGGDDRAVHVLQRSIRERREGDPEASARDRRLVDELERLHGFSPECYDTATLTQEQIAETLKRTRAALLGRGIRNALANTVPVAVGPRTVRIRVPEALAVDELFRDDGGAEAAKDRLLDGLRRRLQSTLDRLLEEIEPIVGKWRRPNPMWTGAAD